MATSPVPTGNNQDDSARRFREARERYSKLNQNKYQTEGLASDSNADEVAMATALDYMRKIAERKPVPIQQSRVRADNQNKTPGLPVPLPVVPVAPEQLIIQRKTNTLIDRLNKNTSKESTLKAVVDTLVQLTSQIERFTQTIIEKFGDISGHWSSRFDQYTDEAKKSNGWFTNIVRKMLGRTDKHQMSFAEALEVFTKPIIKATRGTFDLLQKQFKLLTASNRKEHLDDVRDSLEEEKKAGMFSGLSEALFTKDSAIRKAIDVVAGIRGFFTSIGKWGEEKLKVGESQGGILGNIAGLLVGGGILTKFFTVFGSIGAGLSAIVGSVAFASVYSFFRNPDQFVRLMKAFGELFTEVIQPMINWFVTELVPPLTVLFGALVVVGDQILSGLGTLINETLIGFVNLVTTIGIEMKRQLNERDQAYKKDIENIKSFFKETLPSWWAGFESWWDNLSLSVRTFFSDSIESIKNYFLSLDPLGWLVDKTINMLDYLTGSTTDEEERASIKERTKEILVNFAYSILDVFKSWLPSAETIKSWLPTWQGFKDYIFGNDSTHIGDRFINGMDNPVNPSIVDRVKENVDNVIDSVNKSVGEQFTKGMDSLQSTYDKARDAAEPYMNEAVNKYKDYKSKLDPAIRDIQKRIEDLPIDKWRQMVPEMPIIVAPTTNNQTTNNNMSGGGLGNIGIGSPTAPTSRLDELIFRANPF